MKITILKNLLKGVWSLLERIKEQLKKILKWHKIYRKHLSIFFPDFKLLSRRPGVLPQLHQRQILRREKRPMPRKKKLPVLFAKTTEFSIPLQ
jgi:hypothetical protein